VEKLNGIKESLTPNCESSFLAWKKDLQQESFMSLLRRMFSISIGNAIPSQHD